MKIVLANGCFDLFHYGHLLHLMAARRMGDVLVVSVTDDVHVNKPCRPVFNEKQRAAIVGALKCVSYVVTVSAPLEAFEKVRPDIWVKGIDYVDALEPAHVEYCKAHGIEIRFTDTPKFSATELIDEARRRSQL